MEKKGIATEFAERVFEQIRGFGSYGFPESHAASFALISYATAWVRCHYPAEFTCGLLNAQPMGFYTRATIVEDAKRMGVIMLPVDVTSSEWQCTIETDAVRMGMRFVKGLGPGDFSKISSARSRRPFQNVSDFVKRAQVDLGGLKGLAESGAMGVFGLDRRQALWAIHSLVKDRHDGMAFSRSETGPTFDSLGSFETIGWDYVSTGHSTHGHPLGPLRPQLDSMGLPSATKLASFRNNTRVRYAGMVICRQRPSTASGVTFMTLEDETGFVNLVVWKDLFKRKEVIAKTSHFLGITGKLQVQQGVVHLVAEDLWVPHMDLNPQNAKSRDFH